MADVLIRSVDGDFITVPEGFAQTDSQLRWLQQPRLAGAVAEAHLPIDEVSWHNFTTYSQPVVPRSLQQMFQDFLGRCYLASGPHRNRTEFGVAVCKTCYFFGIEVRQLRRWGAMAQLLRKRKVVWSGRIR